VDTYVPRPIPVQTRQAASVCPWWLWPLLCLLLALAALGLFSLLLNRGGADSNIKVNAKANNTVAKNTVANNNEVENENVTDTET